VAVEVDTVRVGEVERYVTGSGRIKPKRQVKVSASVIGRITKIAVREGDRVEKGDFLLQIDPMDVETRVKQLRSQVRAAESSLEAEKAGLDRAERDFDEAKRLFEGGYVSQREYRAALAELEAARARYHSAEERLSQLKADLESALHDLEEVRITAEMSGVVTSLNVEEGETAVMGTINNPGTVLLVISDLSQMEAEIKVDETEVVHVREGQRAKVELDAYPDTTFRGVVVEVGNSAIRTGGGLGTESVDYKVVILIEDSIPGIRPDLTASAEILVAKEDSALVVPLQALVVRKVPKSGSVRGAEETAKSRTGKKELREAEGAFVVEDGVARFRPVRVGIVGRERCQVLSGLKAGDLVVVGPFRALSALEDGDPVKLRRSKRPAGGR
jgi:HlyD family secretion protein